MVKLMSKVKNAYKEIENIIGHDFISDKDYVKAAYSRKIKKKPEIFFKSLIFSVSFFREAYLPLELFLRIFLWLSDILKLRLFQLPKIQLER